MMKSRRKINILFFSTNANLKFTCVVKDPRVLRSKLKFKSYFTSLAFIGINYLQQIRSFHIHKTYLLKNSALLSSKLEEGENLNILIGLLESVKDANVVRFSCVVNIYQACP